LTPTLSLFTTSCSTPAVTERVIAATVNELKQFSENGGVVLFGTDVGFIKIYDTTLEYELMHRALSERQVLATLTTNPASYFKPQRRQVEQGIDADFAVLDGDPIADVRNLAKVATPSAPAKLSIRGREVLTSPACGGSRRGCALRRHPEVRASCAPRRMDTIRGPSFEARCARTSG